LCFNKVDYSSVFNQFIEFTIGFPSVWQNNLKFVNRKNYFLFKVFIWPPILLPGVAASLQTPPPLPAPVTPLVGVRQLDYMGSLLIRPSLNALVGALLLEQVVAK
jgi:hypothetical protein